MGQSLHLESRRLHLQYVRYMTPVQNNINPPPSTTMSDSEPKPPLETLRILTLNCWGLKFISQHRHARLVQIGHELAALDPPPDIVALQECWTQADFHAVRAATAAILPHAKFYHSGIFGGGLVLLSRFPFLETSMRPYRLNGRPSAFYRGDWYVGKGMATARLRLGPGDVLEVFNTHLHAPYRPDPQDVYACHRAAQAWELARAMRHAAERGHAVLALGDFNMLPASLAHAVVEAHSPARDLWRVLRPASALGPATHPAEIARRTAAAAPAPPSSADCLDLHGATCDSRFNTWRWPPAARRALSRGHAPPVDAAAPDPRAKRLDYIFFADRPHPPPSSAWHLLSARVGMRTPHPRLLCSLSDHFSVEATLTRTTTAGGTPLPRPPLTTPLARPAYDALLALLARALARARRQRRLRLSRAGLALAAHVACVAAAAWSPGGGVAGALVVLGGLALAAGVVEGLLGGLFGGAELRALREWQGEVRAAWEGAEEAEMET